MEKDKPMTLVTLRLTGTNTVMAYLNFPPVTNASALAVPEPPNNYVSTFLTAGC